MDEFTTSLGIITACLTLLTLSLRWNKKLRREHSRFFTLLDIGAALAGFSTVVLGVMDLGLWGLGTVVIGFAYAGLALTVSFVTTEALKGEPPMIPPSGSSNQP